MKISGQMLAWAGSVLIFCLFLTGCATPATPLPAVSSSHPVNARFDVATVASVRRVDLATDVGSLGGIEDVLNALQQSVPASGVTAEEIVLMKTDESAASVVERPPAALAGFTDGDRVAILEGTPTTLIHRN